MLAVTVASILIASLPVPKPLPGCTGTIRVPADYPTIQQAIDASVDGDLVLVDPGTYVELIDFKGKNITVQSSGGPEVTIIDGNELGSVVTFRSGESRGAVLEGFTITNGWGSEFSDEYGNDRVGGGIYCSNSQPTVRGNKLQFNGRWSGKYTVFGGGVFCLDGASPALEHNHISDNIALFGGGGVYALRSSPEIQDNEFLNNLSGIFGSSIHVESSDDVLIRGNRFSSSTTCYIEIDVMLSLSSGELSFNQFLGGGPLQDACGIALYVSEVYVLGNDISGYSGLAIDVEGSRAELCSNWIHENLADYNGTPVVIGFSDAVLRANRIEGNRGSSYGPIWTYESYVQLERNRFVDNQSSYSGGAIYSRASILSGASNLFARNRVEQGGGGALYLDYGAVYKGELDTFADNEAGTGAGAVWLSDGAVDLDHCIVWSNRAGGAASSIGPSTEGVTVRHCDVEGGWPGEGNFDLDPQFVSAPAGDYSLAIDSPCLDAGEESFVARGKDLDGSPRWLDSNLDRMAAVDLGAFELSHARLESSGSSTPGGTLTFLIDGTSGLFGFLWIGVAPGDQVLPPLGSLFIDLSSPWFLFPAGIVPISVDVSIPSEIPVPFYFTVQALCVSVGNAAGNFSNPVEVIIQ